MSRVGSARASGYFTLKDLPSSDDTSHETKTSISLSSKEVKERNTENARLKIKSDIRALGVGNTLREAASNTKSWSETIKFHNFISSLAGKSAKGTGEDRAQTIGADMANNLKTMIKTHDILEASVLYNFSFHDFIEELQEDKKKVDENVSELQGVVDLDLEKITKEQFDSVIKAKAKEAFDKAVAVELAERAAEGNNAALSRTELTRIEHEAKEEVLKQESAKYNSY